MKEKEKSNMKEVVIDKCPYCGGVELKEFPLFGFASLMGRGLRSSNLFALTCRDCGSIVRLYCKDLEKMYPKKERRQ